MARKRMSWDWVKGYPIMVYTTFIDNGVFKVEIVKGPYGNQNSPLCGPSNPPWKSYTSRGPTSKDKVVEIAFRNARHWLKAEGHHQIGELPK